MPAEETPMYRILSTAGFFGPDDHLYGEGERIYWTGEPNEDMEPLNEAADIQMQKFFDKLEEAAKALAKKAGVEYRGRPRTLEQAIELSTMAARRAATTAGDGGVPIMGADKSGIKETIGRVEQAGIPETPQQAASPMKKKGKGVLSVSVPLVTPLSKVATTFA